MDTGKIVSVRISQDMQKILLDGDENARLGTRVQNIVQNHVNMKPFNDFKWMSLPKDAGFFLFSQLNDKGVNEFCDLLIDQIKKMQHAHFPEKSIWETWIIINNYWAQNIGCIFTQKKVGKEQYFFMEHMGNLAISKFAFEMFKRISKDFGSIHVKEMDETKVSLVITEF